MVTRRLESFSNEWQAIIQRQEKNLKKIAEESKRLRTILSAAEIGLMYDMTGYVAMEMNCERVWGVLKDIRFGKESQKKFLPSKVELVFALSAGSREMVINLVHTNTNSNYSKLEDIIVRGQSQSLNGDIWNSEIAKYNNRVIERKIVTGNILGAYSHPAVKKLKPRFITFTLAPDENGVKRVEYGLFMPMDEKRLREELGSVTLPLTEGVRYANSTSKVYPITSLDVCFSLMPVRSYRDGELLFRISVDDKNSKAFEEPIYDTIRGFFKSEPVTSTILPRKSSTNNLNNRKQRMRYYTDNMNFESEAMQRIIMFLAKRKATIVVPRDQITMGEMKQIESQSVHEENEAWPVLDWKHEKEQPLPPSQQDVLLHITPPVVTGNGCGREVQSLSQFVCLCRVTIQMQGCRLSDLNTRLKIKKLYFDWKECSIDIHGKDNVSDSVKARMLQRTVLEELHSILIGNSNLVQLKCYDSLLHFANSERFDMVAEIRERFKKEFLFMAPPKEQVREFIDSCPCSDRLNYLIKALQRYLNGETDVIIA